MPPRFKNCIRTQISASRRPESERFLSHLTIVTRIIRIDPWHQPYEYKGTRNGFTLRSVGPDGKSNTADDIILPGGSH